MATAATTGERTVEVLVDEGSEFVDVATRSLDNALRVEIECRGDEWVYIVEKQDFTARFESTSAEDRRPDWLDRVLRELGAMDVVVEG